MWNSIKYMAMAIAAAGLAVAAAAPASAQSGVYGCGTARPAFGCGGPRGRVVVRPRRISAAARSTAAG